MHLRWIFRNLPNLTKIDLPPEKSHLTKDIPLTMPLNELIVAGQYDCHPSHRFPPTLTKFSFESPTPRALRHFNRLQATTGSCRLKKLSIVALPISQLSQLRTLFSKCCASVEQLYISFQLDSDHDRRDTENNHVLDTIEYICTSFETHAPNLRLLTFAVPSFARLDGDWDSLDLFQLEPYLNQIRSENRRRSNLELEFLFTDVALLKGWMTAMEYAITPTMGVSVEAGHNCVAFFPPEMFGTKPTFLEKARLCTNLRGSYPTLEQMKEFGKGRINQLQYLYISERAVVDKYFYYTDEHREVTLDYVGCVGSVKNVVAQFSFGEWGRRMALWAEDGTSQQEIMDILLGEREERAEYVAYEFLGVVKKVSMSFEVVSYAVGNEGGLEKVLGGMEGVERIDLILPSEKYELGRGEIWIGEKEDFLRGLPVFLEGVKRRCRGVEKVCVEDLGEMEWGESGDGDWEGLFEGAFEAVEEFEREGGDVEGLKAMMEVWWKGRMK